MPVPVDVEPALLAWAQQRSGVATDALERKFPKLAEWAARERKPTLKQLEAFAQTTHTPIGLLFLPEPPVDRLPVPDFRIVGDRALRTPSPDLPDTVHACEQRQGWYRDHVRAEGQGQLTFVGSMATSTLVSAAAAEMRRALRFEPEDRGQFSSWPDAFRGLSERAEALGILVMVNGIVGSNTHRTLDPDEFRGFALVDVYAPVVFVNGADTKAAQNFTLVHELAHIWLGESGVSDASGREAPRSDTERWCNEVAAEFLMPTAAIAGAVQPGEDLADTLQRLARTFRVSTLVVLRRLRDTAQITADAYFRAYDDELGHNRSAGARSSGGR